MKVAIIGSGISGMACAYALEQKGIMPTIFEQRHTVGEPYHHVGVLLQLIYRPVKEPLTHFRKKFNIHLAPLAPLTSIEMNGSGTTKTVTGNLGWFMKRGQDPGTVENQLFSHIKSRVIFNTYINLDDIKDDYDYVVVATGNNHSIPTQLGVASPILQTWVRGQVVLGEFDPNKLIMWTNTNYMKNGYAYLSPFSRDRASLILIVPNTTREELEYYWNLFVDMEKLNYPAVEQFEEDHTANYVYPKQVGNVIMIGTSGGFLDPFLGFGQFSAVASANLAAEAIATNQPFEKLTKELSGIMKNSIAIRERVDRLDNGDYNTLINLLGNPVLAPLIYRTNINFLGFTSKSLTLLNKILPIRPKN